MEKNNKYSLTERMGYIRESTDPLYKRSLTNLLFEAPIQFSKNAFFITKAGDIGKRVHSKGQPPTPDPNKSGEPGAIKVAQWALNNPAVEWVHLARGAGVADVICYDSSDSKVCQIEVKQADAEEEVEHGWMEMTSGMETVWTGLGATVSRGGCTFALPRTLAAFDASGAKMSSQDAGLMTTTANKPSQVDDSGKNVWPRGHVYVVYGTKSKNGKLVSRADAYNDTVLPFDGDWYGPAAAYGPSNPPGPTLTSDPEIQPQKTVSLASALLRWRKKGTTASGRPNRWEPAVLIMGPNDDVPVLLADNDGKPELKPRAVTTTECRLNGDFDLSVVLPKVADEDKFNEERQGAK